MDSKYSTTGDVNNAIMAKLNTTSWLSSMDNSDTDGSMTIDLQGFRKTVQEDT